MTLKFPHRFPLIWIIKMSTSLKISPTKCLLSARQGVIGVGMCNFWGVQILLVQIISAKIVIHSFSVNCTYCPTFSNKMLCHNTKIDSKTYVHKYIYSKLIFKPLDVSTKVIHNYCSVCQNSNN